MDINPNYRDKLLKKAHIATEILKELCHSNIGGFDTNYLSRWITSNRYGGRFEQTRYAVLDLMKELNEKYKIDCLDNILKQWDEEEAKIPLGEDRDQKTEELLRSFLSDFFAPIVQICEEIRTERRQLLWHSMSLKPNGLEYYNNELYREEWKEDMK